MIGRALTGAAIVLAALAVFAGILTAAGVFPWT